MMVWLESRYSSKVWRIGVDEVDEGNGICLDCQLVYYFIGLEAIQGQPL